MYPNELKLKYNNLIIQEGYHYKLLFLDNWRFIQYELNNPYKICPICGIILGRFFLSHLAIHNLTPEIWYCMYQGIDIIQHKCDWCDKEVKFRDDQYNYPQFCSRSCRCAYHNINMNNDLGNPWTPMSWSETQIINRGYKGKNDPKFIEDWIIWEHNNKSLGGKTHDLLYGNNLAPSIWTDEQIKNRGFTGRDDPKYIECIIRWIEGCRKGGYNNIVNNGGMWGNTLHSHVYFSDGSYFSLKSGPEFWLLLYLLIIKKIPESYIRYSIKYNNPLNGPSAKSDFEVTYNTGLKENHEIHPDWDTEVIENKKLCTESAGVKFIFYPTYDQYRFKDELRKLGIPVNKFNNGLYSANHNSRFYEFYLDKYISSGLITH